MSASPVTRAQVIEAYEQVREMCRLRGIPTKHWDLQLGSVSNGRPWRLFTHGDPSTGGTTLGALDDGSLLGKSTREAYLTLRGIRAGLFCLDNWHTRLEAARARGEGLAAPADS